ncbi:D-alanyl-D-alanine carboxypeptidase family protein [Pengzhenrongella sicca]|uniref:D-alanyl-D-alanine dipeptidase n=1 Tax=Pengzhenrongella sicca TaxID=2819238 RepID=A0A8A4ZFU1_9MICO|nr:D-alanyl-D-alanine carboxypeptidase family protein [Pengzhenrongella sicca]
MLLLSDPSVSAVPVLESGEGLLDLQVHGGLLVDMRKQDADGAWSRLRAGVLERLLRAQAALPDGMRLLIIEGHRPVALQRHYFESYRAELGELNPSWPASRLDDEASKHVSPPSVAPHPCGAAVDLTLWQDGVELDMGTRVNATPAASANACFTASRNIPAAARRRRDVLGEALTRAGLVNYPPEWWHWSYGDRYWAAATGAPAAHYSPK